MALAVLALVVPAPHARADTVTNLTFGSVAAVGPSKAWVVGDVKTFLGATFHDFSSQTDAGFVLATIDGGASWVTQTLPAGFGALQVVSFLDADHGWAVGTGGIVATSDGGAHWAAQQVPGSSQILWGVSFATPQAGWAIGNGGLFATTDGGALWSAQPTPASGPLSAVAAVDAAHVWLADCAPVNVLSSADGGATWVSSTVMGGMRPITAIAFDQSAGWIAGGPVAACAGSPSALTGGVFATTSDGGATWSPRSLPVGAGEITGMTFPTPRIGYLTTSGGFGHDPDLLTTVDGGSTWSRHPTCGALGSIAALDAEHIISPDGAVSADGGNTFSPPVGDTDCWYALQRSDASTVNYPGGTPNLQAVNLPQPVLGDVYSPLGPVKWIADSRGDILSYHNAPEGTPVIPSIHPAHPLVGMQATGDSGGFWLAGEDGGVFALGDAGFYGSAGSLRLNTPVVGMAATPDGKGYWLVASDGGIFSYGDAQFFGSAGSIHLNQPIVGMASTPDGGGYWLVAADGGVFTYGDAQFYGSTGSLRLVRPIVAMAGTSTGQGYLLVASDGGVFTFGNASFHGSMGGAAPKIPVRSILPVFPK